MELTPELVESLRPFGWSGVGLIAFWVGLGYWRGWVRLRIARMAKESGERIEIVE